MFFYGEYDIPTVITTGTLGTSARLATGFNLAGAQDGDILVVYIFNNTIYTTANTILSSSASSNWYTLSDTKTASVGLNYTGAMLKSTINCSGNSTGTQATSFYGDIRLIMKRISSAEIASGVTIRCIENANISYMIIRGVTKYEVHKNSSGTAIMPQFSGDIYSPSANSSWPITNTNIDANTQKLYVIGWCAAGTSAMPTATTLLNSGGHYAYRLDKEDLTGSSVPYSLNRGGRAYSFLYNSTTIYSPWASFLGFILT